MYKAFKQGSMLQVVDNYDNMARMVGFHRIAAGLRTI